MGLATASFIVVGVLTLFRAQGRLAR